MTGDIHGNRGGVFTDDGNVYINTGGYADYISNILNNIIINANSRVSKEFYLGDSVDLDTITDSGFYRMNANHPNNPSKDGLDPCNYSQLIVAHGGGDTISQIIIDYSNARMYVRAGNPTNVGGTGYWRGWKKVVTSDENALSSTFPLGFNSHLTSSDWGNTIGTHVTGWDIDGCAVAFRRDNPSAGKLSMKIDGYIYQNEGTYRCLDTSNFSYSNGTLTITT